jgi:hypothetical protein
MGDQSLPDFPGMNTRIRKSSPEVKSPISSVMPNVKEAVKPIRDHSTGMITRTTRNFVSTHSGIPKVDMVGGHIYGSI